jgi:hypothetical protein
MKPGLFNLPELKVGDTYEAITICNGLRYSDGTPIPCTQARMHVRDIFDKLILTFNLNITGVNQNIITTQSLSPSVTSLLTPGTAKYDLEVTLQTTEVWTILEGSLVISDDITK